ncbi:hypothetical protein LOK49_LG09G00557 [Camellia lanceoleosa]|uniref:Uncharacterized protein n=1 Tax=Camellia lanceoleosa TaxID=1840588 RepID=A0ACC0GK16_9ERIC|nr:hypothetical protein LOK49_LG09G00557 [Camellia lanceoleosa]
MPLFASRSSYKGLSPDDKIEMMIEQFKVWLMREYDAGKDGRISKNELREAVRAAGGWFSAWNSSHGIKSADKNGNGFVNENEINLADFGQKKVECVNCSMLKKVMLAFFFTVCVCVST